MVAASAFSPISPEEYLAAEATSPIKHEYQDGEVYAMAGGTDEHNVIAGNLYALLRNHLRGSRCRTYFADVKARIETRNRFYYPDVMVTCDERDLASSTFKRYPCLIVAVLSDSTEAFDRGDKFADYRYLESLQEYVLISQTRPQVEVYRRSAEGLWVLHPYGEGASLEERLAQQFELTSVDWAGAIADLYEEVSFSENPSGHQNPAL
ncbi:MAG: Uma2 family endonuclease [Leptolyngbyaceae cyanobacterium SM2_3_12]|nr:Uma2 family endonuclease [Leptolyngbyaceae cyanobacterium SM2_3_12]